MNLFSGMWLFAWQYPGYVLAAAVAWVVVIVVLYGMDQWQWLLLLIPLAGVIALYLIFHDRIDQRLRRRRDSGPWR